MYIARIGATSAGGGRAAKIKFKHDGGECTIYAKLNKPTFQRDGALDADGSVSVVEGAWRRSDRHVADGLFEKCDAILGRSPGRHMVAGHQGWHDPTKYTTDRDIGGRDEQGHGRRCPRERGDRSHAEAMDRGNLSLAPSNVQRKGLGACPRFGLARRGHRMGCMGDAGMRDGPGQRHCRPPEYGQRESHRRRRAASCWGIQLRRRYGATRSTSTRPPTGAWRLQYKCMDEKQTHFALRCSARTCRAWSLTRSRTSAWPSTLGPSCRRGRLDCGGRYFVVGAFSFRGIGVARSSGCGISVDPRGRGEGEHIRQHIQNLVGPLASAGRIRDVRLAWSDVRTQELRRPSTILHGSLLDGVRS